MKFRLEAQSAFLIAVLGLAPALPGFAQSSSRLPDANGIPLRAGLGDSVRLQNTG